MSKITRIVRLEFQEEHVNDFLLFFEQNNECILAVEGCASLRLMKDVKLSNVFFTISEWESQEMLDQYRSSNFFRTIWPEVKLWFSSKPIAYSLF